ncbi:MAG TPA: hypothetical protein VJZ49_02645 [Syntrophales bacterium]|nr:hypothetical protein [Syntrophales bacterium]
MPLYFIFKSYRKHAKYTAGASNISKGVVISPFPVGVFTTKDYPVAHKHKAVLLRGQKNSIIALNKEDGMQIDNITGNKDCRQ